MVYVSPLTGIALDKKLDLIATDYDRSEVLVSAPPYAKVARRLQHGGPDSEPYHVSIDGSNSLVYVTNYSKPGVFVVDYKSGKVLRKVDGDGGRSTVLTRLLDRPLPQL